MQGQQFDINVQGYGGQRHHFEGWMSVGPTGRRDKSTTVVALLIIALLVGAAFWGVKQQPESAQPSPITAID